MLWRVLGPVEVLTGAGWTGVDAPKWRALLAALLTAPGQAMAIDDLVDELWAEHPPPAARKLVSGYALRLRRLIADPEGRVLVTRAPGYCLMSDRAEVDAFCFEDLLAAGRRALAGRENERAGNLLDQALALWRGPAMADVPRGPAVAAEASRLNELRLDAVELRVEAMIGCARSPELVAELRGLTERYPLRERFWHQLMRVLENSGRTAEALAAYASARKVIARELGADPGPDLQQLHLRLLAGQSADGEPTGSPPPETAPQPDRVVVPRQLPAAVPYFTGRAAGLSALNALLGSARADHAAVAVAAVDGAPGVGKTALAVRWAHQVADSFPDGQLYVDLRGFDRSGEAMPPGTAIRGFLDALGVPAERIPPTPESQAGLYRSLLAGKRVLIVADNARDGGQVRPLLPGSPGCLMLVTSRNRLTGLAAAEGAQLLTLDVLPDAEARELLTRRIGTERAKAEPGAVEQLTRLCGRLPLALVVAAARAAARPKMPLATAAAELAGAAGRLRALETADPVTDVRTVFSWSCQHLDQLPARLFRLLGVHPGPDITIPATAALLAITGDGARAALDILAMANLVGEHVPGRYVLHDLLRAHAAEQATEHEPPAGRQAAIERLLDYYLHTSHAAALLLDPARTPLPLPPPRPGTTPSPLASSSQALAWFDEEHQALLGAITLAAETGNDACAWQLPWAMDSFLNWRGHWQDWAAAQRTALAAAIRLGDSSAQATARSLLAHACTSLGDYDQARAHLTECLVLRQQTGDQAGQARAHQSLGVVAEHQDRPADALSHALQALALCQATGNLATVAAALNNLGWCLVLTDDYQQARTTCRQALALHRQLGHRRGEAHACDSLGYAEHKLGNLAEAADCHRRALAIARDLGDRHFEAELLTHLGDVHHTAGDLTAARDCWHQALRILEDLHHPDAAHARAKVRQHPPPKPPA